MSAIVSFLAETPVHVGVGQSNGAVDLPFARESSTGFPHVPGSGMKGAFRVWSAGAGFDELSRKKLFGVAAGVDGGSSDGAGQLLLGEARLALLPVRSVTNSYLYITCPTILRRLSQDTARAGVRSKPVNIPNVEAGRCLGGNNDFVGLEEREFARKSAIPKEILEIICSIFSQRFASFEGELEDRLIVLSDTDFVWFAEFALQVVTRNSLDENKRVKDGQLWSEELLPSDSLLWMFLGARDERTDLINVYDHLKVNPYLQVGGNETIGQGWLHMSHVLGGEKQC